MAEQEEAGGPIDKPQPENMASWVGNIKDTQTRARNRLSDVLNQMQRNALAEATARKAASEHKDREKERTKKKVEAKVNAHEKVIDTSYECMIAVEDAGKRVEAVVSKLTHERYSGFAMLQVCEKRLKLREKRPLLELFRDRLSEALESEQAKLLAARTTLFALEADGKDTIEALEKMRVELSKDTGERRLDIMHLGRVASGSQDASALSTSHNTSAAAPEEEAAKPPMDSKALLAATQQLLQRAEKIEEKSMKTISRVSKERINANAKSEDCLMMRTQELGKLKKSLETQMLDVDAGIERAERELARTEKRINPNNSAQLEKVTRDRNLVTLLRGSRRELQGEIRSKFSALEIDNMCRRVTPAKAAEKKQKLNKTASAPTLPSISSATEVGGLPDSSFGSDGVRPKSPLDKA